jgi:GT2 family glycosyltransferase
VDWFIANGGLDEQLPGWGSDIDLCFRTDRDLKIVAGHLRVHHPYGTTSKRLGDDRMYQIEMTRHYLLHKHGEAIRRFAPKYIGGYQCK